MIAFRCPPSLAASSRTSPRDNITRREKNGDRSLIAAFGVMFGQGAMRHIPEVGLKAHVGFRKLLSLHYLQSSPGVVLFSGSFVEYSLPMDA
ncbi:MAG: hypothetical protein ABJP44_01215 [Sulfitobacter sp.]|uniref:hypothetical protein n=1 Tax=Sulfitobacter sp. TaxID=1903071 RepID=UPI003297E3B5